MHDELYHFDLYQDAAESTAVYPKKGDNLYYPALGLAGEAGEVCEKITDSAYLPISMQRV